MTAGGRLLAFTVYLIALRTDPRHGSQKYMVNRFLSGKRIRQEIDFAIKPPPYKYTAVQQRQQSQS